MDDSGRRAALLGGIASGALLLILLLGLLFNGPLPADSERFSTPALLFLAGLVLLTAWLLVGSSFWAREDPAWARGVRRFWELPFLALLAGFMFWVRMLPYKSLVQGDRVYYWGYSDPFYHFRATLGAVRSFPKMPRFDPWTFYPVGTPTGQFGSLFDFIAAFYVVLTQGRDASEAYIGQVLAVFPSLMGALMIVPFYFLARRLFGRPGALVAAITLAVLPGEFLNRSIVTYSDHHVAENFFSITFLLALVVAIERAWSARERLADWRDVRRYLPLLAWAVLAGVALAANFYAWPPAVLFAAIATAFLAIVMLLESWKEDGNVRPFAFVGVVCFVTTALLMAPAVESFSLGEFNTYGILHPLVCLGAALVLFLVAWGSEAARRANAHRAFTAAVALATASGLTALGYALKPEETWMVVLLGAAAVAIAAGFVMLFVREARERLGRSLAIGGLAAAAGGIATIVAIAPTEFFLSMRWGLSWITGIGVSRTTNTIGEARPAEFFCGANGTSSCLQDSYGLIAPVSVLLLLALFAWTLWKRRRADVLLLVWSLVIFRASTTQIRFSYYVAVNIALLVGWLASRMAEAAALDTTAEASEARGAVAKVASAKSKGRKTRRIETSARTPRLWGFAAVVAVLLLVAPGNLVASGRSFPSWAYAESIRAPIGSEVLWWDGLDWMRQHTPDAGVDLGAVVKNPGPGRIYDYPPQTYGVLSWWDYGHWIETIAQRPPVANPFQQAAPFAATWFTERDPAAAERQLDAWVQGKGPVRYVFIDEEIPTSKWGAITVWAHSQNDSRDVWADGAFLARRSYDTPTGPVQLTGMGPEWEESMMGRLYDHDGAGLSHYRLVWEQPQYNLVGTVATDRGFRCLHTMLSSSCGNVDFGSAQRLGAGEALATNDGAHVYDTFVASRLKLFERVPGAHLVGTTTPNANVTVGARIAAQPEGEATTRGTFFFEVTGKAGPDGKFDIVFPYSNADPVSPKDGGTDLYAHVTGNILLVAPGGQVAVTIPDRAVLKGETVAVAFG